MIIGSTAQLLAALRQPASSRLIVKGRLRDVPSISLSPGQSLESKDTPAELEFLQGVDGIQLTRDNCVCGIALTGSPECRVIFNDPTLEDAGTYSLSDLRLQGQLQIVARQQLRRAHINIRNVWVTDADTSTRPDVVSGNGVSVLQGAITIWNQQPDAASRLTGELRDVRIGSRDRPVRGGGLFLSGGTSSNAGRLELACIDVHSAYADSGLSEGTTHLVAAAVFVLPNAHAKLVRCRGDVETRGPNCAALDNWGEVEEWIADAELRTHGPSSMPVINAGRLERLRVAGAVETLGQGARCVSIYSDTGTLEFDSLCTRGDGSTALQVTRVLKRLVVKNGIETHGGNGEALVKGKIETLTADCIEIESDGRIEQFLVRGPIIAHGAGMVAIRTHK